MQRAPPHQRFLVIGCLHQQVQIGTGNDDACRSAGYDTLFRRKRANRQPAWPVAAPEKIKVPLSRQVPALMPAPLAIVPGNLSAAAKPLQPTFSKPRSHFAEIERRARILIGEMSTIRNDKRREVDPRLIVVRLVEKSRIRPAIAGRRAPSQVALTQRE